MPNMPAANKRRTPTPTPTPIPALATVLNPEVASRQLFQKEPVLVVVGVGHIIAGALGVAVVVPGISNSFTTVAVFGSQSPLKADDRNTDLVLSFIDVVAVSVILGP